MNDAAPRSPARHHWESRRPLSEHRVERRRRHQYTSHNASNIDFGASALGIGQRHGATGDPLAVQHNQPARPNNAIRYSTQNISPTPLVAANTFGYDLRKTHFLAPGNNVDLIAGNPGVTTIHGANVDDASVLFSLGSDVFRMYNTDYTGGTAGASAMYVSSNGLITFASSNTNYTNDSLLTTTIVPQAAIAPFWDDQHTGSASGASGRVLAKFVDLDANGVNDWLIVEWSEIRDYSDNASNTIFGTYQAMLQLNTGSAPGDIIVNYVDTDFGNASNNAGASATVGIKDVTSPGPRDAATDRQPGGTGHQRCEWEPLRSLRTATPPSPPRRRCTTSHRPA